MHGSNLIGVLFKSGERQNKTCVSAEDAQRITLQIAKPHDGGPSSVEDGTTAIVIAVGEIACLSLGDQSPHQRAAGEPLHPKPQPVSARRRRGLMIAN
jgi:hypothetical protein